MDVGAFIFNWVDLLQMSDPVRFERSSPQETGPATDQTFVLFNTAKHLSAKPIKRHKTTLTGGYQ